MKSNKDYLIEHSNGLITEANVTTVLAIIKSGQAYLSTQDIAGLVQVDELDLYDILSDLVQDGLLEQSADKYTTTGELVDILDLALTAMQADKPKAPAKERTPRKSRGVTEEMTALKDWLEPLLQAKCEMKETKIDRSNYIMQPVKRGANGIKGFELYNKGMFRIVGYKMEMNTKIKLKKAGMSDKVSGSLNYMDIEWTKENIEKILALV